MKLADIVKGAEAEGKEKHVPFIEKKKGHGPEQADVIHVVVGKETPHPNTPEHHIAWVELYGVKPDGQVVSLARAAFAPGYTDPNITFHVPTVDQFKSFHVLSYCNIHGLWQNSIEA